MHTTQKAHWVRYPVTINGVTVEMWDDTVSYTFVPMRAEIEFVAAFAKEYPNDQDAVAVERLRVAGVKYLPPKRTELDEAGIEYVAG